MYSYLFLLLGLTISLHAGQSSPVYTVNKWFKKEKERSEQRVHKIGTLATVSPDGHPHVRMIEIMGFHPQKGALFFTHKHSDQVRQIDYSSQVALNIWLPKTLRQISIEGTVVPAETKDIETSWKKMPRSMKLIFMTCHEQDNEVCEDDLERHKAEIEQLYPREIPTPDTYVGYRIKPEKITFYEMRPRTLPRKHIARIKDGTWSMSQVAP